MAMAMSDFHSAPGTVGAPPSTDAYKRAVYRPAPRSFYVDLLGAAKQGNNYSYGMRIVPILGDQLSTKSGLTTDYEVWRRWEDCLHFQDTLEMQYAVMSRAKRMGLAKGKGVKRLDTDTNTSFYVRSDDAASFESLPPGPDPSSIAKDIHTFIPKLSKKGTLFRASQATVEQRQGEFEALVEALFAEDVPMLVKELRATRTVRDFFGFWRRDRDLALKNGKVNAKDKDRRSSIASSAFSMYFSHGSTANLHPSFDLPPVPALPDPSHAPGSPRMRLAFPLPATTGAAKLATAWRSVPIPASAPPGGTFSLDSDRSSSNSSLGSGTHVSPPAPHDPQYPGNGEPVLVPLNTHIYDSALIVHDTDPPDGLPVPPPRRPRTNSATNPANRNGRVFLDGSPTGTFGEGEYPDVFLPSSVESAGRLSGRANPDRARPPSIVIVNKRHSGASLPQRPMSIGSDVELAYMRASPTSDSHGSLSLSPSADALRRSSSSGSRRRQSVNSNRPMYPHEEEESREPDAADALVDHYLYATRPESPDPVVTTTAVSPRRERICVNHSGQFHLPSPRRSGAEDALSGYLSDSTPQNRLPSRRPGTSDSGYLSDSSGPSSFRRPFTAGPTQQTFAALPVPARPVPRRSKTAEPAPALVPIAVPAPRPFSFASQTSPTSPTADDFPLPPTSRPAPSACAPNPDLLTVKAVLGDTIVVLRVPRGLPFAEVRQRLQDKLVGQEGLALSPSFIVGYAPLEAPAGRPRAGSQARHPHMVPLPTPGELQMRLGPEELQMRRGQSLPGRKRAASVSAGQSAAQMQYVASQRQWDDALVGGCLGNKLTLRVIDLAPPVPPMTPPPLPPSFHPMSG